LNLKAWVERREQEETTHGVIEAQAISGRHATQNRGRLFLCRFGADVRTNDRGRKLGKELGSFVTST
jgi:hypothetical protein